MITQRFPLVSIIIVNYHDEKYIRQLLPILQKNTQYPNYEIILVDNGSEKGFDGWIKKNYRELIYLRLKKNIGFSRANNYGIKLAKGDYYLFLNSDTLPQIGWLELLVKTAESDSKISLVAPLTPNNYDHILYSFKDPSKNYFIQTSRIIGACMLYSKEVAIRIGIFDPEFFFFNEDQDLCYRNWLNGYKVILNLNAIVYHIRNLEDEQSRSNHLRVKNCIISDFIFFWKWAPLCDVLRIYFLTFSNLIFYSFFKPDFKKLVATITGIKYHIRQLHRLIIIRQYNNHKYPNNHKIWREMYNQRQFTIRYFSNKCNSKLDPNQVTGMKRYIKSDFSTTKDSSSHDKKKPRR